MRFEGLQGDAGTHGGLQSGRYSRSCAQAESEGALFLLHAVCTAWLAKSYLSAACYNIFHGNAARQTQHLTVPGEAQPLTVKTRSNALVPSRAFSPLGVFQG